MSLHDDSEDGVKIVQNESYIYSKVKPKHLRQVETTTEAISQENKSEYSSICDSTASRNERPPDSTKDTGTISQPHRVVSRENSGSDLLADVENPSPKQTSAKSHNTNAKKSSQDASSKRFGNVSPPRDRAEHFITETTDSENMHRFSGNTLITDDLIKGKGAKKSFREEWRLWSLKDKIFRKKKSNYEEECQPELHYYEIKHSHETPGRVTMQLETDGTANRYSHSVTNTSLKKEKAGSWNAEGIQTSTYSKAPLHHTVMDTQLIEEDTSNGSPVYNLPDNTPPVHSSQRSIHSGHSTLTSNSSSGTTESSESKYDIDFTRSTYDHIPTPEDQDKSLLCPENSLRVLQTCASCVKPHPNLTLLLCFHLVCPKCAVPYYDDDVLKITCSVCSQVHVLPQEGPMTGSDVFPYQLSCSLTTLHLASAYRDSSRNNISSSDEQDKECDLIREREQRQQFSETSALYPEESGWINVRSLGLGNKQGSHYINKDCFSTTMADFRNMTPECGPERNKPPETQPSTDNFFSGDAVKSTGIYSEDNDYIDSGSVSTLISSLQASQQHEQLNKIFDMFVINSEQQPSASSSFRSCPDNEGQQSHEDSHSSTCGACMERRDVNYVCVTCGVLLCKGCRIGHLNLQVTRWHEVMDVTTENVSPLTLLGRRHPVCYKHGQDLALACHTCGVFLCHRCLTPLHTQHDVKDLANLRHTARKQFTSLQRYIKQHMLSVKSAQRTLNETMEKLEQSHQTLIQEIKSYANRIIEEVTAHAEDMTKDVSKEIEKREQKLKQEEASVKYVEKETTSLKCVLGTITGDTPHLTSLTVLHSCQARYESLQRHNFLHTDDFEELVFCPNVHLHSELVSPFLGDIRCVARDLPGTAMQILHTFKTSEEISGLSVTPHGEIVSISSSFSTCKIWDVHGLLLLDASRHVAQPFAVEVMPVGNIILVDAECKRKAGRDIQEKIAHLKFISPSGSLLSKNTLSSDARFTHISCPDNSCLLVSEEKKGKITLFAIQNKCLVSPRALRTFTSEAILRAPRQVSVNITGDWIINDWGATLRVVSPAGGINTLLSEEGMGTLLPYHHRQQSSGRAGSSRVLGDVHCDSQGRIIAADVGRCGLYIVTGGAKRDGERHYVSLRELAASRQLTALAIDQFDKLYVAMADGSVSVLKIVNELESESVSASEAESVYSVL